MELDQTILTYSKTSLAISNFLKLLEIETNDQLKTYLTVLRLYKTPLEDITISNIQTHINQKDKIAIMYNKLASKKIFNDIREQLLNYYNNIETKENEFKKLNKNKRFGRRF